MSHKIGLTILPPGVPTMTLKSLFTTKKKYKLYLLFLSVPVYFFHSLATKDYWTMLFISCLALFAPVLWTALALYIAYKLCSCIQQSTISQRQIVQDVVIQSVLKNNLTELELAIDANPDILYCEYQRKSLEAWCRYYKNTKAQELIIQLKQKYPKKALAA